MKSTVNMLMAGLVVSAVLAAMPGCHIQGGDEQVGKPLLTLNGFVTNEQALSISDDMRVALLWSHPGEQVNLRVAQETEVNPEFPAFFRLDLYELPPEEVMEEGYWSQNDGGERKVTRGSIVAYHDGNRNGNLDFLPWEEVQSEDTILGIALFSLWYLEGDPIVFAAPPIPEALVWWDVGFTLVSRDDLKFLSRCHALRRPCRERAVPTEEVWHCNDIWRACMKPAPEQPVVELVDGKIPLDSEIRIPLSADPYLVSVICPRDDAYSELHRTFDPVKPETWPEGVSRACSEDGLSVIFRVDEPISQCHANSIPGGGIFPWPTEYQVPDWWPCETVGK